MLSVCIIVKNEQDNLARCLDSLTGVAGEIVVVDTGSTDHSVAVARSFGARTYEFAWTADFSAARNFSLAKAQNRWALVIDADEELDRGSGKSLVQRLAETEYDALSVRVHNYLGDAAQPELMVGASVRLFRTDKGYTYRGLVHEDITPSIVENGGRIGSTDVVLHHYGYLQAMAQNKSRFDRNVRILRAQLDANADDGVVWFYLGTEYFVADRHDEAVECYGRAIDLVDEKSPVRPRLLRNTVESLRRTGQATRGYDLVLKALREYPDYPDLWFLRGLIEEQLDNLSDALESFMRAPTIEAPPIYETNVTATREKANLRAAAILLKQGRHVDSLERVMDVIAINPRLVSAYTLAVQAYLALGKVSAAEEILHMASSVDPAVAEKLSGAVDIIRRIRRFEQRTRR